MLSNERVRNGVKDSQGEVKRDVKREVKRWQVGEIRF
jgi:hypothetical protein